MILDPSYQIHKACSTDPVRTAIHGVHITEDVAIATDGRIMAVVPITLTDDDKRGVTVPAGAIKSRGKTGHLALGTDVVGWLTPTGNASARYITDDFPNWRHVLPPEPTNSIVLRLDAALLFSLAEAIGAPGTRDHAKARVVVVTIDADNRTRPWRVTTDTNSALGVFMPMGGTQ